MSTTKTPPSSPPARRLAGHLHLGLVGALCLCTLGCSDASKAAGADASSGSSSSTDPNAATSTWTSLGGLDSNFRNDSETRLTLDNAADLVDGWDFETLGTPTGTPAIVGSRVFVTATGGTYCLDRDDGSVLWESNVGTTSSPTYVDGVLYVHASNARMYALDADDGSVIWDVTTSDHSAASGTSSPVVAGDTVLIGLSSGEEGSVTTGAASRGGVVAFDAKDGAERRRYATAVAPFNGSAVWSTVSVDMEVGVVFATTGNNYTGEPGPHSDAMFAISLEHGERVWLTQLQGGDVFTNRNLSTGLNQGPDYDFGTNPILFEGEVDGQMRKLVGAGQKSGIFWVLDRESGEVVWEHKVSLGSSAGGILNNGAFDGERILIAGFPGISDGPGSAVPTSGGYGASLGGITPLLTMLSSCAAGVAVVNIDNGFGAGFMAALITRKRRGD